MTDQDRKRRTKGRRKKTLFEFIEHPEENNKYNKFESCRLEEKNDIESHSSIMGSHPNYLIIFYTFVVNYKQILKIFGSTKMKSIIRNFRNNGSFAIILIICIFLK
ncbi:MAG TPA: hypothetical protein VJ697_05930 [Nitrososphaeraceae archaeon]|nr:hypothetical protein [Nitrososphaeraceae archaeon]